MTTMTPATSGVKELLDQCSPQLAKETLLFILNRDPKAETQILLEELNHAEPGTEITDFHYRGVHYTYRIEIVRKGFMSREWRADGEPNKWK